MNFKDYFSTQSSDYAKYRPRYPKELFAYLASVAPDRESAWDCATGNGQAALGLADFFAHVVATDASDSQIEHAVKHDKIKYQLATAEKTNLPSSSIALVTVAQALHWLDLNEFYREVKRVLKPGGVLAVWCYNLLQISPTIDREVEVFYEEIVGPYWPPERRLVEDAYRSISFPFEELKPPAFHMEAMWSLADLAGYLGTWSATQKFIEARGVNPLAMIGDKLLASWGSPEELKPVRWPLGIRVGVLPSSVNTGVGC